MCSTPPREHRKEAATTKALTFTGGRAEFASDKIILDTLTIAKNDSGNYVEGTDYAVDYNFTKGTVIITSLKDDAQLTGNLTATFYEVDDSVEDSDIIGGVTSSGEYSGLSAIALRPLYSAEEVMPVMTSLSAVAQLVQLPITTATSPARVPASATRVDEDLATV